MRRIDAIGITFGVFVAGGILYLLLQATGLDSIQAGIWTQAALVAVLLGWLGTYLFRVFTQQMTYNQQLKDYEAAVLQKRLEELTPEELAALEAQLQAEEQAEETP